METITQYLEKGIQLEDVCREESPFLRSMYHCLMQHRLGTLNPQQIQLLQQTGTIFLELVLSTVQSQMQSDMQLHGLQHYDRNALHDYFIQRYQSIMKQFSAKVSTLSISKEELKNEILQQAPSKLIDGFWLEHVSLLRNNLHEKTEIMSILHESILRLLERIFEEEEGEGQLSKNHVYLFQQLLTQCDMQSICDNSSLEFATNSQIGTEKFLNPVLQLLIGFLQKEYVPELIGFTLSFEQVPLSVLEMMHFLQYYQWDATYYRLHLTIDNNVAGHAAMAEQATNLFMEHVQSMFFDKSETIQFYWQRIWRGYHLANVCHFSTVVKQQQQPMTTIQRNLEQEMKQMLTKYEPFVKGCPFHSKIKLGNDKTLDQVSMYHKDILTWLQDSSHVKKGNAKQSKLYFSFFGKMIGIFSKQDQQLIQQWINTLSEKETQKEEKKKRIESLPLWKLWYSIAFVLIVIISFLFIK